MVCALAPAAASAQGVYVASTPQIGTAPASTGWQSINFVDDYGYSDDDEGVAKVLIPFSFNYFGKTYNSVFASANGVFYFENGTAANPTCDGSYSSACSTAHAFPDTEAPNAVVGLWWGDMDISGGSAQYTTSGTSPDRIFSVRYTGWGAYDYPTPAGPRSAQVDFYEKTGAIRMYFGAITKASTNSDECSVGIEDSTATQGLNGLACNANSAHCSQDDWPAGKFIEFAPAVDPDLMAVAVVGSPLVPTTVNGNPGFSTSVSVTVKNQGQNAATGFVYDLYLSTDKVIDPATDTKLASHLTPQTLAGYATATYTDQGLSFERPSGSGSFYIGVVLDPTSAAKPTGDVKEALESNNTGASAAYVIGQELAGSVSGPTTSGPGELVDLAVTVRNRGTDAAGPFNYEVWLSEDDTLDPAVDKRFLVKTLTLGPGETFSQPVQATLPAIADGAYHYILAVDPPTTVAPKGDVTEIDETDNVSASAGTVTMSASDLIVENIRVEQPVSPYPDTTRAYFGEKVRVEFTVRNKGGSSARNFNVALFLSDNATITLSDYDMTPAAAPLKGLTYVGAESHDFAVEVEVPATTLAGAPYRDGTYYVGVIADVLSKVPESNESNNIQRAPSGIYVRQPAIDATVARVDAPAAGALGELLPVQRVLRNLGNRGNLTSGAALEYRYVLSSNEIISPEDIPLNVLVSGVASPTATVRLDAFSDDRQTDLVQIPADVAPGTYFVGVIVDPANAVPELDEANNTAASGTTVEVVPGTLAVDTRWLPDAIVGVDYVQYLSASGGDGTYRWELEPGQGELPRGLTLAANGGILGQPTADNLSPGSGAAWAVFTVNVTSANRTARARLALRMSAPTGALGVVSSRLPTGFKGFEYNARLSAAGGVRPYTWRVAGATALPQGLSLEPGGLLKGLLLNSLPAPVTFEVEVRDAWGAVARGALTLKVVEPGSLAITTNKLGDAIVGLPYSHQLLALGGKAPLAWSIAGGGLPEGIRLSGAALTGIASRPGVYPVKLAVTDGTGDRDETDLALVVLPRATAVVMPNAPDARPGEGYSLDLGAGAAPGAVFALYAGALPPGLTLSSGGLVAGTVASDAPSRTFDALVHVIDPSGSEALAPLSVHVAARPAEQEAPAQAGCSSAPGAAMAWLGLTALLPLWRRRRSMDS